jgi:hypothetical protein
MTVHWLCRDLKEASGLLEQSLLHLALFSWAVGGAGLKPLKDSEKRPHH